MVENTLGLDIELRPSRWFLVVGGLTHGLAGLAVVLAGVPMGLKAGFILGLGLSAVWLGWRNGSHRYYQFIVRIALLDGHWRLQTRDGLIHPARLRGGCIHPLITILNFHLDQGRSRSITLLPDSAEAEDLRRLRVWLRVYRDPERASIAS